MGTSARPNRDPAGAETHFIVAVLTLKPRIEACIRALGVEDQDVGDLIHDTLLAVILQRRQFDPARGKLASWVLEIARNKARRARRKARREPVAGELEDALASPEEESPFERTRAREVQETLEAMLARLPPEQRVVIEEHCLNDRTLTEVAAALGIRRGTIAKRKRIAKGTLEADARRRKAKARRKGEESLPMLLPFLPRRTGTRGTPGRLIAAVGGAAVATILLLDPSRMFSSPPSAAGAPAPALTATAAPPAPAPEVAPVTTSTPAPPAPALDATSAPAHVPLPNGSDEVSLLRRAMEAALAGRTAEARRRIQEHERLYPKSRHAPDRAEVMRIIEWRPAK